jgi:hypothetical protein
VFLDVNGNGALDAGEPSAVSDGNGAFAFAGVTPGTYVLSVSAPAYHGMLYGSTAARRTVTVTAGASVSADLGAVLISQVFPIVGVTTGLPPAANALRAVTPDRYAPRPTPTTPTPPSCAACTGPSSAAKPTPPDWPTTSPRSRTAPAAAVVDAFFNSTEHRSEEVDAFYHTFLGRAVDVSDPSDLAGRAGFCGDGTRAGRPRGRDRTARPARHLRRAHSRRAGDAVVRPVAGVRHEAP